jgi:hypothetical protein
MKKVLLLVLLTSLLSSCLIVHVPHRSPCGLPKHKPKYKHHHRGHCGLPQYKPKYSHHHR